jgi:hypothetical protein
MKRLGKTLCVAALATGVLAITASEASASIVCNGEGVCWHVRTVYAYQPAWGLRVYPNSWHWGPGVNYRWREHAGRGYWRNGVWIVF